MRPVLLRPPVARRRQRGFLINPYAYGSAAASDPHWANVVLLALMTGANGGTTFTDSKARHTLTANGNAQTSTAQSIGSYGSSGLFDANGDWVEVTNNLTTDFFLQGSTAFTIEAWVRPANVAATMNVLGCRNIGSGVGWNIDIFSNGTFFLVGSTSVGSPAGTVTAGAWQHLTANRTGGTDTLYHNGVCVASAAAITIQNHVTDGFRIGARTNNSGYMDGHIAAVRVTVGAARYAGTTVGVTYFTPPTDFPTS